VGTPYGGRDDGPGMHALESLSEASNHPVRVLAQVLHIKRLAPPADVTQDALNKMLQLVVCNLAGVKKLQYGPILHPWI
jgi:hypothetical protein